MLALIVVSRLQIKPAGFGTAFDAERVRLAFLLTHHRGQMYAADLELTLDAEQALAAAN